MADIGDEFGAVPVKEEDDIGAEFGAVRVKSPAHLPVTLPAAQAQASIQKALGTTPAKGPGLLERAGTAALQTVADIGTGAISGIPFGLGPTLVGALPGTSKEEAELAIAEARKRAPIAFGVGEFGAELPTFLTGAGVGEAAAARFAPKLTRAFPVLSKARGGLEAALKGLGLGVVTGEEAAFRAAMEGGTAGEALEAGAKTGASMAALPGAFAAAPAAARAIPGLAGRAVQFIAPAAAPATLAYASMPGKGADAADWTKWALAQGALAGGELGLEGGPKEAFERLASKSRESIQPKLRRATAEGMEMARGDIYKDVRADEAVRNQQFRAAMRSEQRAMRTAEKVKQGDLTEVDRMARDALDLEALVKGLGEGTDPSLRGLLGKLFQDTSNRLLRARQALENRPELASKELVDKINTVDRLITESYLKNTEKGGYLEDFNDDPYARLEVERQARLKRATAQQDALASRQAKLLEDIKTRNYLEEARARQRPPTVPEDVARSLAEQAGLEYAGPDEQFGKPVRHPLKLSPEQQAELEAQTKAEFERQVAAGGRTLRGQAPEAEYGEKPKFLNVMDIGRARAATQPLLPDLVQPNVALRTIAGPVRALAKAPESEFRSTQAVREERRPTETTMEKPYSTVAMLRAFDKALERPSPRTTGILAKIADRFGLTYEQLTKTTAYRAALLEEVLKDPEARDEVLGAASR